MKKLIAVGFALCVGSTAALAQHDLGDGTYLAPQKLKSDLTRSEVLSKTDSLNVANASDGTYSPSVASNGVLSRTEVVRKMEGFQFADFGDGTAVQPWIRKQEAPRTLANQDATGTTRSAN